MGPMAHDVICPFWGQSLIKYQHTTRRLQFSATKKALATAGLHWFLSGQGSLIPLDGPTNDIYPHSKPDCNSYVPCHPGQSAPSSESCVIMIISFFIIWVVPTQTFFSSLKWNTKPTPIMKSSSKYLAGILHSQGFISRSSASFAKPYTGSPIQACAPLVAVCTATPCSNAAIRTLSCLRPQIPFFSRAPRRQPPRPPTLALPALVPHAGPPVFVLNIIFKVASIIRKCGALLWLLLLLLLFQNVFPVYLGFRICTKCHAKESDPVDAFFFQPVAYHPLHCFATR